MNTATETAAPSAFVVGTVYSTGERRDYVWRFRVIKRTAKFITIQQVTPGAAAAPVRVGVHVWNGSEYALPLGSYSMAPTIEASAPHA